MSDEQYALSTSAAAPPPTEADYEAILAAVMETVRGRWFLAEFARRNRQADTRLVLAAIERLEASLRGEREGPSIERIRVDIRDMARAIDLAKREIAAIKPDQEHGGRIGQATEELDSIVQTTEQATSDILAAAEQIQETAWTLREQGVDGMACDQLDGRSTDIYLACSFQDLTGQRIRKVIQVLRYLEGRISTMVEILGADDPEGAPPQPASDDALDGRAGQFDTTLDQAEIDEVIPATHAGRMGAEPGSRLIIDHEPMRPGAAAPADPSAPARAEASARPEAAVDDRPASSDDLVSAHEPDVAPTWATAAEPVHAEAADQPGPPAPCPEGSPPAAPEPASPATVVVASALPDLAAAPAAAEPHGPRDAAPASADAGEPEARCVEPEPPSASAPAKPAGLAEEQPSAELDAATRLPDVPPAAELDTAVALAEALPAAEANTTAGFADAAPATEVDTAIGLADVLPAAEADAGPDAAAAAEPATFAIDTMIAPLLPVLAADVAAPPEPAGAVAPIAADAPAPPQGVDEPAFEFELLDHSAPSAETGPRAAGADAEAWLQASALASIAVPPLETATFEPIAVGEPPAIPEAAGETETPTVAPDSAEIGGTPALSLEPPAEAVPDARIGNVLHRPVAVDTQALLSDLLAIIRPAARNEAALLQVEPGGDRAEAAAPATDEISPDAGLPRGDGETSGPAGVAPERSLPETQQAVAFAAFAPPSADDIAHPTESETPTEAADGAAAAPREATNVDALASAEAARGAEDAQEPAIAYGQAPPDHPDTVEPGILSAELLIVPAGEPSWEATGFTGIPERAAAEFPEIDVGPISPGPAMQPAEEPGAADGATDGGPAPGAALPDHDNGPVMAGLALPDIDVVVVDADEDIFLPTAEPAASVPAVIEQGPAVAPATAAPATPMPEASVPVRPAIAPAAAPLFRASQGGLGATTIEVPLAQAAARVELLVVSPPQSGQPLPPLATDAMPVRSAIEVPSPAVATAAPEGTAPAAPAPRAAAPLAANDPLAAIAALTVEEKIALFS